MGLEARGTERARKGTKSSTSHQKGSRVNAEMGAWGLGLNRSLKRLRGWKIGSPIFGICFVVVVVLDDTINFYPIS